VRPSTKTQNSDIDGSKRLLIPQLDDITRYHNRQWVPLNGGLPKPSLGGPGQESDLLLLLKLVEMVGDMGCTTRAAVAILPSQGPQLQSLAAVDHVLDKGIIICLRKYLMCVIIPCSFKGTVVDCLNHHHTNQP
jgi:hypothetical protein